MAMRCRGHRHASLAHCMCCGARTLNNPRRNFALTWRHTPLQRYCSIGNESPAQSSSDTVIGHRHARSRAAQGVPECTRLKDRWVCRLFQALPKQQDCCERVDSSGHPPATSTPGLVQTEDVTTFRAQSPRRVNSGIMKPTRKAKKNEKKNGTKRNFVERPHLDTSRPPKGCTTLVKCEMQCLELKTTRTHWPSSPSAAHGGFNFEPGNRDRKLGRNE
eukprot:jgi/Bigna1/78026/fgenesh1_pg.52_\